MRRARRASRPGVHVTSDIEAARPKTPAILDAVTIPIFAEHVPGDLTGERDIERALRILRQRHAGMLVVTLGARGAAMLDGDRFIRQPAFPVDVIDTTGAGDVFRAGFIYALLRGDTPEGILRFACAAAGVELHPPRRHRQRPLPRRSQRAARLGSGVPASTLRSTLAISRELPPSAKATRSA